MLFEPEPHESNEDPSSPRLTSIPAAYSIREEEPSLPQQEVPATRPHISPRHDPGLDVLGYSHLRIHAVESSPESASVGSPAMTDQAGSSQTAQRDEPTSEEHVASEKIAAKAVAVAALAKEGTPQSPPESREQAKRVDSAHDELPQATVPKQQPRSGQATPLRLQTSGTVSASDDTITTSPRLARHAIPIEEGNVGTLPALQQPTSPVTNGAPTSPERLPSFRQLTQLADAATQQENRAPQYSHRHSQSFGSATAPSPVLPYHIASHPQMSPNSAYAFSARSPTSAIGDHYSSPTQYPGNAYYMERRTSTLTDHPLGMPPSLPSASSSESHGPGGSSTDGYSTTHTTPIDSTLIPDGVTRNMPILPPPRGMPPHSAAMLIGGFRCDYPGCEAAPFATQYLLSSHRNVHSSVRSHYCPMEGCPRSEGGKGFKRKNEMIRHGLVHNSPGYVCPFCPEREHKYPRPDNLQRHVRVHHAEKERDDPQLREVLNQRTEGMGKTRRKRANTGPC